MAATIKHMKQADSVRRQAKKQYESVCTEAILTLYGAMLP